VQKAALYITALVLPFLLFLGISWLLPGVLVVTESQFTRAPPDLVFELLDSHEGMEQWAHWAEEERPGLSAGPGSGPSEGVGCTWVWEMDGQPWGSMSIEELEEGQRIVYAVAYSESEIQRILEIEPDGLATRITWTERALLSSSMQRWLGLIAHESVRSELSKALRTLDAAAADLQAARMTPKDPAGDDDSSP